ncbi:PBIP1 protein, partial [Daphoenositta chrysoptera]|nr:PBIP1 protein [Daphoenositta chrysoptera]
PTRAGGHLAATWTFGPVSSSAGPLESVGSWDLAAGEQELLLSTDSNVRRGLETGRMRAEGVFNALRASNLPVRQDSQQKAPLPDAGGPQSMQSMSQLLDKLAKENQEIRLMQAELQAHKEDLRALLHGYEGEAAAAGGQQQSLAAENARLRA